MLQSKSKTKLSYSNLAIIILICNIFTSCQNAWKVGRTFKSDKSKYVYRIDTSRGHLGITRMASDAKMQSDGYHFYKITAHHDAWVELDTTNSNWDLVSATLFKHQLIFSALKSIDTRKNVLNDTAQENN